MTNSSLLLVPPDILINEILPKLSTRYLNYLCQTEKRFINICRNETIWVRKLQLEYPEFLKKKPDEISYLNFYKKIYSKPRIPVYWSGDIITTIPILSNNSKLAVKTIKRLVSQKFSDILFLNNELIPVSIYLGDENKENKKNKEKFINYSLVKISYIILVENSRRVESIMKHMNQLLKYEDDYLKIKLEFITLSSKYSLLSETDTRHIEDQQKRYDDIYIELLQNIKALIFDYIKNILFPKNSIIPIYTYTRHGVLLVYQWILSTTNEAEYPCKSLDINQLLELLYYINNKIDWKGLDLPKEQLCENLRLESAKIGHYFS